MSYRAKGMPVMMCHLTACLMDRTLDCRWDSAHNDSIFHLAALKEGAMRLTYMGDFRPMSFLSETVGLSVCLSLVVTSVSRSMSIFVSTYLCLCTSLPISVYTLHNMQMIKHLLSFLMIPFFVLRATVFRDAVFI